MSKNCCQAHHEEPQHTNATSGHDHSHDHGHSGKGILSMLFPAVISFVLLMTGLALDHFISTGWFEGGMRAAWYLVAYLPVGFPVLKEAFESIKSGDVFSEFLLMGIATTGAFIIREYPEGVAVMLFYSVGEAFQNLAVSKAKGNIKALLDQRPDEVTVLRNNEPHTLKAEDVAIGAIVQLKPGEKLALDGTLISDRASFNTSALTGESKPDVKQKGDTVLAGMINLNTVSTVAVTTAYENSKLSKILELVQNAASQKAPTELFIRKFARIYTPIVVFLAIGICVLPYFFVSPYVFYDWLYRALIFLVISCPCALVISIPLGYFGGIGAASRRGILFKGGNFLDKMAVIKHVVTDKTGTLTAGVFKVQEVNIIPEFEQAGLLDMVNALEALSTHPIATAVHDYVGPPSKNMVIEKAEEIPGYGLKGVIQNRELLVGNFRLLDKFNIPYPKELTAIVYTVMAIACDGKFAGYITIADHIKEDAALTIARLHQLGIKVTMLSGDKTSVVQYVAKQLGIDNAFGDLLPEDKVEKVRALKRRNERVAFVGDGVNDAPVVALSDVGIAMGGLGSDATIETADIVIQDDRPSKIPIAIRIGQQTKNIVWQNIALAFVVKGIVLVLGAGGIATMWEAVFADVGVAFIAIVNAIRIQRMKF